MLARLIALAAVLMAGAVAMTACTARAGVLESIPAGELRLAGWRASGHAGPQSRRQAGKLIGRTEMLCGGTCDAVKT
jgi:hypothetical protein